MVMRFATGVLLALSFVASADGQAGSQAKPGTGVPADDSEFAGLVKGWTTKPSFYLPW